MTLGEFDSGVVGFSIEVEQPMIKSRTKEDIVAESNNLAFIYFVEQVSNLLRIKPEYRDNYSLDDIMAFVSSYVDFISGSYSEIAFKDNFLISYKLYTNVSLPSLESYIKKHRGDSFLKKFNSDVLGKIYSLIKKRDSIITAKGIEFYELSNSSVRLLKSINNKLLSYFYTLKGADKSGLSISYLGKSIHLFPENSMAYIKRAYSYRLKHDYVSAYNDLDHASRIDFNNYLRFMLEVSFVSI